MNAKEKEIKNFMDSLGISREEAEQLWKDDHSDCLTEEQAELEKKAKLGQQAVVCGKNGKPKVVSAKYLVRKMRSRKTGI